MLDVLLRYSVPAVKLKEAPGEQLAIERVV